MSYQKVVGSKKLQVLEVMNLREGFNLLRKGKRRLRGGKEEKGMQTGGSACKESTPRKGKAVGFHNQRENRWPRQGALLDKGAQKRQNTLGSVFSGRWLKLHIKDLSGHCLKKWRVHVALRISSFPQFHEEKRHEKKAWQFQNGSSFDQRSYNRARRQLLKSKRRLNSLIQVDIEQVWTD